MVETTLDHHHGPGKISDLILDHYSNFNLRGNLWGLHVRVASVEEGDYNHLHSVRFPLPLGDQHAYEVSREGGQGPLDQVWCPSSTHQSTRGELESKTSVGAWMQMDPPELGEAHYLGRDAFLSR